MTSPARIYESASLYDLAFSYRDFPKESEFLRRVHLERSGVVAKNFLEVAAGPARHALEMARRGLEAQALDLSSAMAAYGRTCAEAQGLSLPYVVADMTKFRLPTRFDLVVCMLCSATHLLTDEQLLKHLKCVAAVLTNTGSYIIELPHPAEQTKPKTSSQWTIETDTGKLEVTWVESSRQRDVATMDVCLEFSPTGGGAVQTVTDRVMQRGIAPARLALLAGNAGLCVTNTFGALNEKVAIDDDDAWRMVAVLGKQVTR